MRVYHEVLPPGLGRAMYRIREALRRWAPAGVEFVNDPRRADLQIVDPIGVGFVEEAIRHERLVMLQHCARTAGELSFWLPWWRRAVLVVSYHDLPGWARADDFPFFRMPWGVEMTVFSPQAVPRDRMVMTSGYDDGQEAIRECHEAAWVLGWRTVHLNRSFGWMRGRNVDVVEGISDIALAHWYSRCRHVSGLRRVEGFELPALEGLCCGARPLLFDRPGERFWYGLHGFFVPEGSPMTLTGSLRELFTVQPPPVMAMERAHVGERFGWRQLATAFWGRVEAAMAVRA